MLALQRVLALALVPFLLATVLGAGLTPGWGWSLPETKALDAIVGVRYRIKGPRPVDSRIVLIGLDDKLFPYLGTPALFWETDVARLIGGLIDGGATAVGLDMIFGVDARRLPRPFQDYFSDSLIQMIQQIATGKLVMLDALMQSQTENMMDQAHREATAEMGNLGIGSVLQDEDLTYRYTLLTPASGAYKSFSLRLAELTLGEKSRWEKDTLSLGKRKIPWEGAPDKPELRVDYPTAEYHWLSAASLLQQLDRKQPLQGFAGKTCLIGPHSASFQDFRPSPLEGVAQKTEEGTRGLEHHAAALQDLLEGNFLVRYPLWVSLLACWAAAGLFAWFAYKLPVRASLASALLVVCTFLLGLVYEFIELGHWAPCVAPLLSAGGAYGWGYLIRYLQVERDRHRTRDFFSRMVSPEVVKRVLDEPGMHRLGGSQRRVTVLYTDINDFTPACESNTPGDVIVMLNRYFEAMVDIVFANEGMLKQFVGDEIMVIYGAPTHQSDHAARAVKTALEMLDRLHEMDHSQAGFYDIKLGIHTGDVVVGHVGSRAHMEYAAVGDDVNLGARIMNATKTLGAKLLVSEITRREAAPLLTEVEWISHGEQSFKGKTARMEVWEVRRKRT